MVRAQHTELHHRDYQRTRILSAMVSAASARGTESVTVRDITGLAGVSRGTFYALFADRDDCMRATIEEAVALAAVRADAAYDSGARWVERVRRGLQALLELADEEPELARLCVERALVSRLTHPSLDRAVDRLAEIIDQGRGASTASRQPPRVIAQSVLGEALGLIYARLISRDGESIVELRNPLMATIVLPYLGRSAARREQLRTPAAQSVGERNTTSSGAHPELGMRLTYRTTRVLGVLAVQSALSNSEVAARARITDQGQVSKLLARLARLGLIENTGAGQASGAANAWRLTRSGRDLLRKAERVSMSAIP